jgi:hypothetical protein
MEPVIISISLFNSPIVDVVLGLIVLIVIFKVVGYVLQSVLP